SSSVPVVWPGRPSLRGRSAHRKALDDRKAAIPDLGDEEVADRVVVWRQREPSACALHRRPPPDHPIERSFYAVTAVSAVEQRIADHVDRIVGEGLAVVGFGAGQRLVVPGELPRPAGPGWRV